MAALILPSRTAVIKTAIEAIERTLVITQEDAAAQAGAIIIVLEQIGLIAFADTPSARQNKP